MISWSKSTNQKPSRKLINYVVHVCRVLVSLDLPISVHPVDDYFAVSQILKTTMTVWWLCDIQKIIVSALSFLTVFKSIVLPTCCAKHTQNPWSKSHSWLLFQFDDGKWSALKWNRRSFELHCHQEMTPKVETRSRSPRRSSLSWPCSRWSRIAMDVLWTWSLPDNFTFPSAIGALYSASGSNSKPPLGVAIVVCLNPVSKCEVAFGGVEFGSHGGGAIEQNGEIKDIDQTTMKQNETE